MLNIDRLRAFTESLTTRNSQVLSLRRLAARADAIVRVAVALMGNPDYNDSFAVGENHGFNYEIDTSASSFNVDAYGITSTCSGIEGLPGRTTGSTPNAVYFEPFALTIPPSLAETQCTLARLAAITFPNEPVHLLETFYTAKVEKRIHNRVALWVESRETRVFPNDR
jgi:hypothetical protein